MSDSESDADLRSSRKASRKERDFSPIFGSDSDAETKKKAITSPRARKEDKFEALLKLPAGDSKALDEDTTTGLSESKKKSPGAPDEDGDSAVVGNGRSSPSKLGDSPKKAVNSGGGSGNSPVKAGSAGEGGGDADEGKDDDVDGKEEEDRESRSGRRGRPAGSRASSKSPQRTDLSPELSQGKREGRLQGKTQKKRKDSPFGDSDDEGSKETKDDTATPKGAKRTRRGSPLLSDKDEEQTPSSQRGRSGRKTAPAASDDEEEENLPQSKRVAGSRTRKSSAPPSDAEEAPPTVKRTAKGGDRKAAAAAQPNSRGRLRKSANDKAPATKSGSKSASAKVKDRDPADSASDSEARGKPNQADEDSDKGQSDQAEDQDKDGAASRANPKRSTRAAAPKANGHANLDSDEEQNGPDEANESDENYEEEEGGKVEQRSHRKKSTRAEKAAGDDAEDVEEEQTSAKNTRPVGRPPVAGGAGRRKSSKTSAEPRRSGRAKAAKEDSGDGADSDGPENNARASPVVSDGEVFTPGRSQIGSKKTRKLKRLGTARKSAAHRPSAKTKRVIRSKDDQDSSDEDEPVVGHLFSRGGSLHTSLKQLVVSVTRCTSMMGDLAAEIHHLRETIRETVE